MSLIQYLGKNPEDGNPIIKLVLPDELKRYFKAKPDEMVNTKWFFKFCQRSLAIQKGLTKKEAELVHRVVHDANFAKNPKPGQRKSKYRPILANSIHDPHVIAFNQAQADAQAADDKKKPR